MKTRTAVLFVAVGFVGMVIGVVVEWSFASSSRKAALDVIRDFHGICNVGVGQPYQDFIRQLRIIVESGDTNRLVSVLRHADERSRDIYDVWLGHDLPEYHEKYRKSIAEILK